MPDLKFPAGMTYYALPGFEKSIQAAMDEELRHRTDDDLAGFFSGDWFVVLPGLPRERPQAAAERTRSPQWRAGTRRTKRHARRRRG